MKVWGTFKGYSGTYTANSFRRNYADDEWLCGLYLTESMAKAAVEDFGGGKDFDSNRENQITRYYKNGNTIFEKGEETECLEKGGYCEWMRYASLDVQEPEEKSVYSL